MSLESILDQSVVEIRNLHLDNLKLNSNEDGFLRRNKPRYHIGDKSPYAALSFHDDAFFGLHFRPKAVSNPLAVGEEIGHYISLASNPFMRQKLFHSDKKSEEYIMLVYREEYIARALALLYLKHKGINLSENNIWSKLEDNQVVLVTQRPEDGLSHYLGYTMAERDFKSLSEEQLWAKLRRVIYSMDLSEFSDIERPIMPQIVTAPPPNPSGKQVYRLLN